MRPDPAVVLIVGGAGATSSLRSRIPGPAADPDHPGSRVNGFGGGAIRPVYP